MPASASASASAAAPVVSLDCRLCDQSFSTLEEKRQHAKSEWHVYKLRCRVAEPGTTIPPPHSGPKPASTRRQRQDRISSSNSPSVESEDDSERDTSSDSEVDIIDFIPENCLFCNKTSVNFDSNLSHMHQAHSLVIPHQSSLTVDLETVIWFLHVAIFSYRECISCGTRRRTVEAVQQHMTSLGHCRFDITEEIQVFYNMDSLAQQTESPAADPDDRTLRLPSGKLLAHRSYVDSTPKTRRRETSPGLLSAPTTAEATEADPTPQALTKRDRRDQLLTAQVAQLRAGDQLSLVGLPRHQQQSLLVTQRKELDKAKRAERRKQSRMDDVGNKTAVHTNYYKQEVPVYMGG